MSKKRTNTKFPKSERPAEQRNEVLQVETKKESFIKKHLIAFISVVISLISLYYTSKVREHNRLTVTPKLQFTYISDNTHGEFFIILKNKGIGPAIIDNLLFTSNKGEIYSTSKYQGEFCTTIFQNLKTPDSILYKNIFAFQMMPGSAMSANEEIKILAIYSKELDNQDYVNTLLKLVKSKLVVNYHSFYGDSFSDSLSISEFKAVSIPK